MRILYLADVRFPLDRANGIQTIETCYALAERGHEVVLFVRPDTASPPRDPLEFYGLPPQRALHIVRARVSGSETRRRLGYLTQALATIARKGRTDAVFTRDLTVASVALGLPRTLRPPLVYESHGLAAVFAETRPEIISGARAASPSKVRRLLARDARVWRLADGYVTITGGLADDLRTRFGPRPRTATIPDGARLEADRQFTPPARSAHPLVAYAGHLYPWKGVDLLLGALVHLPDVRALIVGGHPAERDLGRVKALAVALGVNDRVTFTGFVPRREVHALLQKADVLVMPHTATPVSERYASPLKLFEYMAMGKPIVASDLSAVREVLHDGTNACLVTPGDTHALASGLTRVLADPSLATTIARRAYDDAGMYTWAKRGERLEVLLQTVVTEA